MTLSPPRLHASTASGFTLIEAIVVIVMIAILASVIVPRFGGNDLRIAEAEAAELQRLLTTAAEKSLLSGQPVALAYVAADKRFDLLVQRPTARAADLTWRPDPLVAPVRLTRAAIKQLVVDGRPASPGANSTTAFFPARPRPDLRIVLEPPGSPNTKFEIALSPDSTSATLTGSSRSARADATPRTIDLDDTGRGTKPW